MRDLLRTSSLALSLLTFAACASKPALEPVPSSLDLTKVPSQSVAVTARKYSFDPAEVHVKAGTLLTLSVTSADVTHGIAIPDYGIDETLDPGVTRTIRVYLDTPGEHTFHCSHFCGIGHLGMKGRIVVDAP
jgi:heme/copper-type cytochrome/quinol oxidase subunit 2